ncbi:MAG: hypothetical protein AAFP80_03900 [Pseudomonadota bacterium]
MKMFLMALVLGAISACNTTSDIDTTLGSVTPVSGQQPLPPPAVPDSVQTDTPDTEYSAPVSSSQTQLLADPQSLSQADPAAQVSDDDLVPKLQIRNTGTYPNINVEREPSLQQFTPEEQAQLTAYMTQLRERHQAGSISTAQFQRQLAFLQNLARTHSRDALRQIGAL